MDRPKRPSTESQLSVPIKESDFAKLTEKFRVPELNLVCTERCEQTLLECFVGCGNDMNCVSDCIREETNCIQGKSLKMFKIGFWIFKHILDCPCEIGCVDGCDDCDNAVCQCEVRYIMTTDDFNHIILGSGDESRLEHMH